MIAKEFNVLREDDPLFEFCKNGQDEPVRAFLASGGSVYAASENRPHLAATALTAGHINIVEIMLKFDLAINEPLNRFGETPLFFGVSNKHIDLVRYLLAKGADANKVDDYGCSAFVSACGGSSLEIVLLLLGHGVDINDRRFKGVTPFRQASRNNQLATMEVLLKAGAKLDEPDNQKNTPLIGCAKGGKFEAVQWLVEHGADATAKDGNGKTALNWAKENGHIKIVEFLQKSG